MKLVDNPPDKYVLLSEHRKLLSKYESAQKALVKEMSKLKAYRTATFKQRIKFLIKGEL